MPSTETKPTQAQLDDLKAKDAGYQAARGNAVSFLQGRKASIATVARRYRLDPEELFQEAYEVLLTCLRDFSPLFEKEPGQFIPVQFTTFFGSRVESRGMEIRNRDPEYQARQAMTEGMSAEERERFRSDPPLLVQHLDLDSANRENLYSEVSRARGRMSEDVRFKIARDSFFDKKLAELVAREKDEKKQAALLHVKVGGVYNFQEIAYHFGVTDSRASQVMNELMDAFYVQRLIDGDIESVAYDFKKLKFNEKRVLRLLGEAVPNAATDRRAELVKTFASTYPAVEDMAAKATQPVAPAAAVAESTEAEPAEETFDDTKAPAYEHVFTDAENTAFPLKEVSLRPISFLKSLELDFRPAEDEASFQAYLARQDDNSPMHPAVVSEEGYILDGERRIRAARARGRTEYLCLVRKVPTDFDRKLLRVVINTRLHASSKLEMYYAIKALSSLGLSQQKMSEYLGTSRTNVIVYCKVRDRAAPRLRALFEDGLLQITNAASCVDLPEEIQNALVDFVRRNGQGWSKGAKFNKLLAAAAEGTMAQLEPSGAARTAYAAPMDAPAANVPMGEAAARKLAALEKQLEHTVSALKDAEIWAQQRESVISTQTEQLAHTKSEVDALRRELEAAELMRYGNPKAVEEELKQLKQFYAFTERLAGAAHSLDAAAGEVRKVDLRRKQLLETFDLLETVERALNTLRLELVGRGNQLGVARKVG